ncbi:hypothetical protein D3C77_392470 [compost metagenome]
MYNWAYPYPYMYRVDDKYQMALDLIRTSVQGERNDELFYDELIRLAPDEEQKNIIISIRDDERKHNKLFRHIYYSLTGQQITGVSNEQFIRPKTYLDGIRQALFGELAAVDKYKQIWLGLPEGEFRDTVMGILLDELKHSGKYNYLFTLNSVK